MNVINAADAQIATCSRFCSCVESRPCCWRPLTTRICTRRRTHVAKATATSRQQIDVSTWLVSRTYGGLYWAKHNHPRSSAPSSLSLAHISPPNRRRPLPLTHHLFASLAYCMRKLNAEISLSHTRTPTLCLARHEASISISTRTRGCRARKGIIRSDHESLFGSQGNYHKSS